MQVPSAVSFKSSWCGKRRHDAPLMPKLGIFMPNMGRKSSTAPAHAGLADALFSGTRQRLLGLLFGQPSRSFYATELIGLAGIGSGAVQRELANLAQSGLVTVRAVGNQKHYQANPESPIFEELRGITEKTVGLAEPLREALAPLAPQIHAAFVYGSIAKRTDTSASDVDLMLLSDQVSYADTFAALEGASSRLGRKVNPTILTSNEFYKRVKAEESFLTRVLAQPKVWIIGGESDLAV
jgi:predicted nucleotidyltransferase